MPANPNRGNAALNWRSCSKESVKIMSNGKERFLGWLGFVSGIVIISLLLFSRSLGAVNAVFDGKVVYEKNCKKCHGDNGKGNDKVAGALKIDRAKLDLNDKETTDKKDGEWERVVNDGAGKMKGYKDKLSKEEISAVIIYVKSLKK